MGLVELLSTPQVATTLSILGLLLAALGIFTTIRYRPRRPKLVARWVTYGLVGPLSREPRFSLSSNSQLRITYDGEPVTRAGRAYIAVWNAGGAPIRAEDAISGGSGVLVRLTKAERLLGDPIIATTTSPLLGAEAAPVSATTNCVSLHFSVLEQNDGMLLEILYEGEGVSAELAEAHYIGLRGQLRTDRGLDLRERPRSFSVNLKDHWMFRDRVDRALAFTYCGLCGFAILWGVVGRSNEIILIGTSRLVPFVTIWVLTALLDSLDLRRLHPRKRQAPQHLSHFPNVQPGDEAVNDGTEPAGR